MVLNATFNNISAISWQSVLLVRETTINLSQVTDKLLSHNVVSSTPRHERSLNSQLLVVIGTDCTGLVYTNLD
jgi:hypothetical protein